MHAYEIDTLADVKAPDDINDTGAFDTLVYRYTVHRNKSLRRWWPFVYLHTHTREMHVFFLSTSQGENTRIIDRLMMIERLAGNNYFSDMHHAFVTALGVIDRCLENLTHHISVIFARMQMVFRKPTEIRIQFTLRDMCRVNNGRGSWTRGIKNALIRHRSA